MHPLINNKVKDKFKKESVIFLKNLFNKELCNQTKSWLEKNEEFIISRFKKEGRGLVTEKYKNKDCIKYFEYPLYSNPEIFSPFVNSTIFDYASQLMGKEVIFKSLEIHSRFPGSKLIPLHQDNAYYGLEDGNALSFYTPINKQSSLQGGLTYLSLKKNSGIHKHKLSKASGFSLEIEDKEKAFLSNPKIKFDYEAGDCSIHYSTSMHFAEEVPKYAKRAWVVRHSFYASDAKVSDKHLTFYKNMIKKNRELNLKK